MNSLSIRPTAVAGMFYPSHPQKLSQLIKKFIDEAKIEIKQKPKAIISPHAGYVYSGPIAGYSYKILLPYKREYKTIILLGPSHFEYIPGIAYHSSDYFETPLGIIPIDKSAIQKIQDFSFVFENDKAHRREHSIEVQLPFLQYIFGNEIMIIPLAIGKVDPEDVVKVLQTLYTDQTLIVVSSDLSHYLDYSTAKAIDEKTALAIENQNPYDIHQEQACGRIGIQALLIFAKQKQWSTIRLDLRNSGDTAGDRKRVVGYGSWCFV
ncbi:MAG: AmmeMemoRadiSam system protein B [Leptospiraceae bacterium]|nr:AmmeMemoRadiSam system protein B [Leptospiraceae bacterium]MDW7976156.1 AmmeMemoRadiSam system protein B [Leptospiraceae bacterium]